MTGFLKGPKECWCAVIPSSSAGTGSAALSLGVRRFAVVRLQQYRNARDAQFCM